MRNTNSSGIHKSHEIQEENNVDYHIHILSLCVLLFFFVVFILNISTDNMFMRQWINELEGSVLPREFLVLVSINKREKEWKKSTEEKRLQTDTANSNIINKRNKKDDVFIL